MPLLKLEPIPSYGETMTIDEFQEVVDSRSFSDYDGFGYYATDSQMSNVKVRPSEVVGGVPEHFREMFSHVIWFNR